VLPVDRQHIEGIETDLGIVPPSAEDQPRAAVVRALDDILVNRFETGAIDGLSLKTCRSPASMWTIRDWV
jgi:hypothetical protein